MFLSQLRKLDIPSAESLTRKQFYQLLAPYALITLAMFWVFPIWIPLIVLAAINLKLIAIHKHFNFNRWLLLLLGILAITLVVMNFQVLGREYTALAFLYLFSALKLLEAKESRDSFLLMLINMLLTLGVLMGSQGALMFLYMLFCFVYNFFVQLQLSTPTGVNIKFKGQLKTILKVLAISLPFVVLLFYFFPRVSPLWAQPQAPKPTTGLSDEMQPNSLGSLAQSDAMAFRVQFEGGKVPPRSKQYWRGPVLWRFDGIKWTQGVVFREPPQFTANDNSRYDYRVVVDGATNQWVPVLDLPSEYSANVRVGGDYQVLARKPVTKASGFQFSSFTDYQLTSITDWQRRIGTEIPTGLYPQTEAFAKTLYTESTDDADFIQRVLAYFTQEEFFYSLEPLAGTENIDRFLFELRAGYCEHYASSFAYLVRSVGIPVRVVTGYQGGEVNPVSGEYEVRQLNAHAWTEVYLQNQGWVRIDPTAAVAPYRVQDGNVFTSAEGTDSLSAISQLRHSSQAFNSLVNYMNAANAFWQNWVIGFDEDKQSGLLEKLGLSKAKSIAWIIFLVILAILVVVLSVIFMRLRKRYEGDEVSRLMLKWLAELKRQEIHKQSSESFNQFLTRHESALGNHYGLAKNIIIAYNQLRFSPQPKIDKQILKKLIKDFFIQSKKSL